MGYAINSSDIFVGRRKLRESLPTLLPQARKEHSRIVITDRGEPEAVCLPIEEYEAMLELIEDLHDRNLVEMVSESRREIQRGEVMEAAGLREFLDLDKR